MMLQSGLLLLVVISMLGVYRYNLYRFKKGESAYPPRGSFVEVEGIRLHFIQKGEGQPLVFLHGGVLWSEDFRQVIDIAATRGYRGIAFDRPGYGYSDRLASERVGPEAQARLLHSALKQLGIDKPILIAHSWSGTMALAYALNYRGELAGVVTLGAAMYKEGYPAENGDPISKLVTTPVWGSIVLHTLLATLGPLMAEGTLKATFAPEPVPDDYRKATRALWLRPGQFRANREDILAFPAESERMSKHYSEIDVPLVIAVGERDPFETKEQSYRLSKEIAHAQLIVIPDAAHMLPQNHPRAVMEAVEALVHDGLQEKSIARMKNLQA